LRAAGDPDTAGVDLGPGEAFGERALLGSGALPAAVALTRVRRSPLPRHAIDPGAAARPDSPQSYQPLVAGRPAAHGWGPQLEKADCGLAALAMVARRLGAGVSVEELRRKATPGPEGLTLQQLRRLAEEVGLRCQSVRVSVDRLGRVC